MVMVGLMGGIKVEANLNVIMAKRLRIMGSVMRSQPLQNKIAITRRFQERWLPLLESGVLKPVIATSFPLADAAAAHRYMEENRNVGKILLTI
jgi:NADPH2:quinone reductase